MTQPEKDESIHEAPNSSQQELLNLRSPVHHEQDLSLASEVEISYELSTDNSLISKDSIIEIDEIPISKSSTVSSISKSTVIDLLNNDQEIINKEDIEDDNGHNLLKEGDAQKENPDETNLQEHESHTSDVIDQNVLIEIPIIPDEEVSANELNVTLKKEIENKSDTLEKSKSVNLDSDNQIVDSDTVGDNMDTKPVVSESSPQDTTPGLVNTAILIDTISSEQAKSQIDDYINMDDTNAEVSMESTSNVANEQPAHNQTAEVEEPLPEKTDESLADSSLPESSNNLIAHVQSSSDIKTNNSDTNDNPMVDVSKEEHTAKIAYEQSDAVMVTEIHKENEKETETKAMDKIGVQNNSTPEIPTKNIVELEENHSINKEIQNEVGIKEIKIDCEEPINKEDIEVAANDFNSLIKNIRDSTGNDNIEKNHDDIEEKEGETKNETEITALILNSDSEINDGSNFVTDVLKAEEDVPQNENENIQNNMDLETAAVTIQKVFRSFLFKSRNSTFEDITNDEAISLDEDNDKKVNEKVISIVVSGSSSEVFLNCRYFLYCNILDYIFFLGRILRRRS